MSVSISIPDSEASSGSTGSRRRDGVFGSFLQAAAGLVSQPRVAQQSQARRRNGRTWCSSRLIVFGILAVIACVWALYVLRRVFVATTPEVSDSKPSQKELRERDPVNWPDAVGEAPFPLKPPKSAPTEPDTAPAVAPSGEPPPTPLEDAYALQRLQAGVDAAEDEDRSAGSAWDTGSMGAEAARAAVRAALLRDHEAALEKDRQEHADAHGDGHPTTDHSAAHHHDS